MNSYSKIDRSEATALLFPSTSTTMSPCPADAEDVSIEPEYGVILNCRFYCSAQDAPVLFVFPATDAATQPFDAVAKNYLRHGMNVFLASYYGCGNNSGSPSVAALYAYSEKLFARSADWLNDKGCSGPIFMMGQSLGSICAIDTVYKNSGSVKGLILESGICGTAAFLQSLGAGPDQIDFPEEDGFNNLIKIEQIKVPTLIFHGSRDTLVPVAEAERLQAASGARTKQFFVIPGAERHTIGETGGDPYIRAIKQFIDTACGVNTWRQKRKHHKSNQ